MTLEWAVNYFGYPAIVIGTFFEGEIILILAGFAAHRGYLHLPLVILAAFLGTLFGDQLYFFLGRRRGQAVLSKHPNWKGRIARFNALMNKYDSVILLLFRFLYGLRTVGPFAIGLSDIPVKKFIIMNIISAAMWASIIGMLGYVFGHAMEIVLDDIKRYEIGVIAGLLALAVVLIIVKRYRNRKRVRAMNSHHTDK
jgi:membrane protein DedA with SNARE-associated domain